MDIVEILLEIMKALYCIPPSDSGRKVYYIFLFSNLLFKAMFILTTNT